MRRGSLVADVSVQDATPEVVVAYMTGAH
jgi:hypothetical protein